jgi:hypothetical protein
MVPKSVADAAAADKAVVENGEAVQNGDAN